ncbi:MAG: GGDEF domain-containing protein, partial [Campylobacterota bacterium]|nr:GGDEF domain-containing protein [Campylobacterota bacterium]
MHKPNKFGDDLSKVRQDFFYTNRTKKRVKGFTQGRTSHGFRNTYPIFDRDGTYLGAMEISYSSDGFQNYLTTISNIHTHFLVNKHIFETNAWKRDDLVVKYTQSAEHEDYMLTINGLHSKQYCVVENRENFADKRNRIDRGIMLERAFSVYSQLSDKSIIVASFLPVKNLEKTQTIAWIVSYKKSPFIASTIKNVRYWRLGFLLLFLILVYLIYTLAVTMKRLEEEHKLLNDVLNATDGIMFMTNFNKVTFSNRKFKEFFNVYSEDEFNAKHKILLDLLIQNDGYLHRGLIGDMSFEQLIEKTPEGERIVLILDKHLTPKSFNITLSKTTEENHYSYLVTLTDITKLKEKELSIKKKAYTDALTGVSNRNKFDEVVRLEFNRNARYKRNLSVAIVDIDHFKSFNDTYGHLIGDEILIMLAHYLNTHVRDTDIFARWGGEEFAILFPETPKEEVKTICEKLRIGIEQLTHAKAGSVTASFGVTQYEEEDTIKSMFNRCDKALYRAKKSGRNRVCVE